MRNAALQRGTLQLELVPDYNRRVFIKTGCVQIYYVTKGIKWLQLSVTMPN